MCVGGVDSPFMFFLIDAPIFFFCLPNRLQDFDVLQFCLQELTK